MRALIVGGGVGGLSAAIALRSRGWEIDLFEKSEQLREAGAGLLLLPNGTRALGHLGVQSAVQAVSVPIGTSDFRDWRGRALQRSSLQELTREARAPILGVHRADLLAILAAAAEGVTIHLNARCVGYTLNERGVVARLADGTAVEGDVLIGADGVRSDVRRQALGDAPARYAGYTCWRGVTAEASRVVEAGQAFEAWGPGQRFGVVPLSRDRAYWFATRNAREGAMVPLGERKRALGALFREWFTQVPALIAATDEEAILQHDLYDRKPVIRWGEGRATLLGDAAHPTTPNLGQGVSLALEDAVVLGRCLAGATDIPRALRSYESARQSRTAWITNASWNFGRLAQWENPFACTLRDNLVRLLPRRAGEGQLRRIALYEM